MTARAYFDLQVLSPSAGLVLEARSPDNGNALTRDGTTVVGHGFGAMQRHFRYQLRETSSGRVLWERWQEGKEPSPVRAYVSDDGYSVVRAHFVDWASEQLLFIDREGRLRLSVVVTSREGADPVARLEDGGARDRAAEGRHVTWADENVQGSTAGPHWTGGSAAVFFIAPRAHFSLRTWWGRRIIVDLDAMDLVPDAAQVGAITAAVRAEERSEILAAFRNLTPHVVDGSADTLERARLIGALALVMEHRCPEVAPYLHQLERLRQPGNGQSSHVLGDQWHTEMALLPTLARLALRFLGQEPAPGGNYVFKPGAPWVKQEEVVGHHLDVGRGSIASWDEARRIAPGTLPEVVLARIGAPDFIRSCSRKVGKFYVWSEVWEYDGPEATTLLNWPFPENSSRGARAQSRPLEGSDLVAPPRWVGHDRAEALFKYAPG